MKLKIQKWGDGAAVRLSHSMLSRMGVKVGDSLDVNFCAREVTFRKSTPQYKLSDLMAEMPNGLPRVRGWDELPAVGRESI